MGKTRRAGRAGRDGAWHPAGLSDPACLAVALAERVRAEVAERVAEQPADVHLGDAELLADLGLGHAAAEAQEQDLLLALGQAHPRAWRGPAS